MNHPRDRNIIGDDDDEVVGNNDDDDDDDDDDIHVRAHSSSDMSVVVVPLSFQSTRVCNPDDDDDDEDGDKEEDECAMFSNCKSELHCGDNI